MQVIVSEGRTRLYLAGADSRCPKVFRILTRGYVSCTRAVNEFCVDLT